MALRKLVAKQLGELLREHKLITEAQLQEAIKVQQKDGRLIGDVLVSLGYIREEEIAQALTIQYGFPFLPLDNYDIDNATIKLIPFEVAKNEGVIPVDKIGTTLTVAMVNPLNLKALDQIKGLTKCNVQPFVTTTTSFKKALKRYYR